MSFLDAILGRTRPPKPNLDALFALPTAAVALETEAGFRPTGQGGVCFKPASGQPFVSMREELAQLLALGAPEKGPEITEEEDRYGYHWVVLKQPDLGALVTNVHLVNSTLEERGYGPQLLCSVVAFAPQDGRRAYLVYLYKRGTFYPFAPLEGERRDNTLELRIRALLEDELPIESELTRWFPIWGAPIF